MAVDPACMRNRVATDIWNDFSTAPYYKDREKKVRTGTRGRFVEVFLNGRYYGIYCMTEKMDRKQLKLKKFKSAAESTSGSDEVHGLLYKSSQWSSRCQRKAVGFVALAVVDVVEHVLAMIVGGKQEVDEEVVVLGHGEVEIVGHVGIKL